METTVIASSELTPKTLTGVSIDITRNRITEPEVALYMAFWTLGQTGSSGSVDVAIDGACLSIQGKILFDLDMFLSKFGWNKTSIRAEVELNAKRRTTPMQFSRGLHRISLYPSPSRIDLITHMASRRVLIECKGGSLVPKRGSKDRMQLQTVIGQLITSRDPSDGDCLIVAVPDTVTFRRLRNEFLDAPLFRKTGVQIALVSPYGNVSGATLFGNAIRY